MRKVQPSRVAKKGKAFTVDTSPTKDVVVSGLTRDATVHACMFDLLDNAIDAAREAIYGMSPSEAKLSLPENYANYGVQLTLSGAGMKIVDNCGGIPIDRLKNMVLRFGQRSTRDMGIGVFGVGLNRALFKLGRVTHLTTDTGVQRAALMLRVDDYLRSPEWELPAEEFASTGPVGTTIEITQAPEDMAQQFADADWVEELRQRLGERYGRFVAKGFAIDVNGVRIVDREVALRSDGPYEGEYKVYRTEEGVSIHLRYGQHLLHRFSKEPDYERATNLKLSPQFGWNVLCNDRTILVADRTDKTGWDTKFHTEFNGFVGYASFVGPDPAMLPWNTTKTDVDLNNHAYRLALKDMRHFAEKWRKLSDERKKPGGLPKPLPQKGPNTGSGPDGRTENRVGPAAVGENKRPKGNSPSKLDVATMIKKKDVNEFRTILPEDVSELHCMDKHLVVVHEAKLLDLAEHTYTGLALMRMLFEFSVVLFLHRHGKIAELKQAAVDQRRAKGMTIAAGEEKNVQPGFDEMLPYLETHPEVWGAKSNHLRHCLRKMSAHQKTMNSALHNPLQLFNAQKAFEIRDEVLPLLRHLIEG